MSSEGTNVHYCTDDKGPFWGVINHDSGRVEVYPTKENDPPKFPKIPDHLVETLIDDGWEEPYVRGEDKRL